MANVHLIEDKSLGGLKREYVETDRKADVGDYVIHNLDNPKSFTDNRLYEVLHDDRNGEITVNDDKGRQHVLSFVNYKTLTPTDIVVIENKRYRLVDRKADVGEKVVVLDVDSPWFELGEVFEVYDNEFAVPAVSNEHDDNVLDGDYYVLESVEPVTFDERQASPEVIDILGNLAQRIVGLESANKRLLDEIDTLHANQKRLGEELANSLTKTPFDAEDVSAVSYDEVIVEMAKLLVESHRAKVGE